MQKKLVIVTFTWSESNIQGWDFPIWKSGALKCREVPCPNLERHFSSSLQWGDRKIDENVRDDEAARNSSGIASKLLRPSALAVSIKMYVSERPCADKQGGQFHQWAAQMSEKTCCPSIAVWNIRSIHPRRTFLIIILKNGDINTTKTCFKKIIILMGKWEFYCRVISANPSNPAAAVSQISLLKGK